MRVRLILLGIILIALPACQGQSQSGETETSKTSIGKLVTELPPQIWSIFHDQKGNYWFGSNGSGVFQYDGDSLMQFTKEDGLPDNQIREIQEDKTGNLYVDTQAGIAKYDGKTFTLLKADYASPNDWKLNPDDLWFKGEGIQNGVYRYDGTTLYFLTFPEHDLEEAFGIPFEPSRYSPYGIYDTYKDSKGNMWFGTFIAGVYRFDGESFLWFGEKELTILDDGRAPGIRAIIEDKDGDFWLSNSLHRYRIIQNDSAAYEKLEGVGEAKGENKMDFPYFLSAVLDNENKDLWMITYSNGIWKYDGENLYNEKITIDGRNVYLFTIYKDNQGAIWVGTDVGALRFNGKSFEKFSL